MSRLLRAPDDSLVTTSAHDPAAPPVDTSFCREEDPPRVGGFIGGGLPPAATLAAASAAAAAAGAARDGRRGEGQERAELRAPPGAGRLAATTIGAASSSDVSRPAEELDSPARRCGKGHLLPLVHLPVVFSRASSR